jgi:DNA modification methylase
MSTSAMTIEHRAVRELIPYVRNARTHSKKQIRQIADSIERFGFTNPVLIGDDDGIIAGHGRVAAALLLGLQTVPTVRLSHLTEAERRAYVLTDNKLALSAGWSNDLLAIELQALIELNFDVELTGFSLAEIDIVLDQAADADPAAPDAPEDAIIPVADQAVTRRGDLWQLGRHRLICGDAREPEDYVALLAGEQADLVFTDPPYNCRVDGHVCGLGAIKHREFAMASGEMTDGEFTGFLSHTLGATAAHCRDGAIAFVCMDWRNMQPLMTAGRSAFTELKNLVVWNKTNGGMGAFYRSKHELIFVYKVGTAPHTNSFGLGETGRYRTNVWDYAGISSIGGARMEELAMHPTVKPVAMVADAIRDCSRRGEVVLDAFGGSGTTLIAAERCGRSGRLIEYDPLYCDAIIRRWQKLTGKIAKLVSTGAPFDEAAPATGLADNREVA